MASVQNVTRSYSSPAALFYAMFVLTIVLVILMGYLTYIARNSYNAIISGERSGCPVYTCPKYSSSSSLSNTITGSAAYRINAIDEPAIKQTNTGMNPPKAKPADAEYTENGI